MYSDQKTPDQQAGKKTYNSPQLLVYGTVAELTETVATGPNFDAFGARTG